jgi:DNA-binding FrmR family transcriptional regulator
MDDVTKKSILNRLNRAEGQIGALKRLLDSTELEDCKSYITQVRAVRSALQRIGEQYVLAHIHRCQSLPKEEREKKITEAISLLASD